MTSLPGHGQQQKIRRLARLTRKDGIPVALFWIDDDHIGWAAAHNSKWTHTFCFMQMGLHNGEPERLVSQNFSDGQGRFPQGGWGGPDDVYYDAGSHTLIFSGDAVITVLQSEYCVCPKEEVKDCRYLTWQEGDGLLCVVRFETRRNRCST